ncbi:hypothetical protein [Paenibacillus thiaminolyticus]|uniref:hypothetical protein n=1 Tax=Paenibacillus thiaminolyticus TaxID=49283 RepID=UPI0021758DB8|nr:hypothetical protein [Paenibacillus thiaminolyticus]
MEAVSKLYRKIDSIDNDSIKLALYNLILDYSRSHGIMPYIAKSMYQRYLIERNDFSRLKETYQNGKYILHYADFLSSEERASLYYKLGIHAYTLSNHNECIAYCKEVLKVGGHYKADALGVLIDAYFSIGAYTESELYLLQYKNFAYPNIKENVVLMDAFYAAKKEVSTKPSNSLHHFLRYVAMRPLFRRQNNFFNCTYRRKTLKGLKLFWRTTRQLPL